jgi:hypothetical protein
MHSKVLAKLKKLSPQQRAVLGVAVIAVVLMAFALLSRSPHRSVEAYCSVYREEKARLAKLPGEAYPSGVFNEAVSDAGAFATAFDRLERVAPSDIQPDLKTLHAIYQKIDNDPSQALAASLSAISPDESVKKWTNDHCGK